MKKLLHLRLLLIFLFFFLALPAQAEVFEINLFYKTSTGEIKFDDQKPQPIELDEENNLSITEFMDKNGGLEGKMAAVILDKSNNELLRAPFDPPAGAFKVVLPYFSLAAQIKIVDQKTQQELLKGDVSKFSSCNTNGICEYELRETFKNCLGDCASSKITYSQDTQNLLKQNKGIIKDPKTGEVMLKDERFADPTFTPPPSTPPPSTTGPSGTSPSVTSEPAVEPEREVSTWRVILLGIFVFVSATGMVFYLRRKMKQ